MLGSRVDRALARLTTPPSVSMLGWSVDPRARRLRLPGRRRADTGPMVRPAPLTSARRLTAEPEWRYRVDFRADAGGEPLVPGRSTASQHRARELRAIYGWSLMHCIVGRNNLGDLEFLPTTAREPDGTPGLVRQSLWFEKASIRAGGEPERLPYTVYDLPFTLTSADASTPAPRPH
jgi:hypothetical protein